MSHKAYHKKNNPTYNALLKLVGFNKFHIYNILPENPPKQAIDKLRGDLQALKWVGLVSVLKGKAEVKVRGVKREFTQYQLVWTWVKFG